ncbi:polysaccharide deacetylase family protein [Rasiella sp. SM2506]|uniref:polysaccharide deacetylase family protein n=1 Tax=Rasiella sp. SM2506 TaxID=3423914 RepID=UPI003D7AE2C0
MQWLFPRRVWAFSRKEPNIYLTFDDGPIPEVTPWVLDLLKEYDAKATFFCIGENVKKHPEIFKRIIAEGHRIGNHTFHHLNGWKTKREEYLKDIVAAEKQFNSIQLSEKTPLKSTQGDTNVASTKIQIFKNIQAPSSNLFRPPYGKMTSKQEKEIRNKGYKIVMWDVLSADFDPSTSKEKCLQNVTKNIKLGSIVVFHDSLKAEKNLRYVLPKVLDLFNIKLIDSCI